jgi:hypothetical protein
MLETEHFCQSVETENAGVEGRTFVVFNEYFPMVWITPWNVARPAHTRLPALFAEEKVGVAATVAPSVSHTFCFEN